MVTKGLLAAVLALTGVAASAAISGSAHDFSTKAPYGTAGQICSACHAPHNGTNGALGQLWNHTPSAVTPYLMYTSGSMTPGGGQPSGTSKLCLSCHDGTVAVDSFGGATGGDGSTLALKSSNIGGVAGNDLTNDHPIGIDYATAFTADGALWATSTMVTIGSAAPYKTKTDTLVKTLLNGGTTVECASCHDVHNTFSMPAGSGIGGSGTTTTNKLLRVSVKGSALCIACHDK
jgi:hypothetical protein